MVMDLFGITFRSVLDGLVRADDEVETTTGNGRRKEIELPEYGALKITQWLDFMGDTCLRTNLVTKKAMSYSSDGDVIEIITDNPTTVETIPLMLPNYNCVHLATSHEGDYWRIYIGKGNVWFDNLLINDV